MHILLTCEKVGDGMGKTRKDAQEQATENDLYNLAGEKLSSLP